MKKKDGKKIYNAMNGIGDDLINEADAFRGGEKKTAEQPKKRGFLTGWRRYATVAAAVLLIVALSVSMISILIPAVSVIPPDDGGTTPGGNEDVTTPGGKKPEGILLSGEAYATDRLAEIPDELKSVTVTAGGEDRIISTGASFRVKTSGACEVDTLAQYLSVTPSTYMTVNKVSDTEFDLIPTEDGLVPGTVYRVTVGNPENPAASYAFQTESRLVVKSVLPTDKATNVPLNTGIEVSFSESVKTDDLDEYITVSPAVKGSWYRFPNGRTVALVPEENLEYDTVYTVSVSAGIESTSGKKLEADTVSYFRTVEKSNTQRPKTYIYIDFKYKYKNLTAFFRQYENVVFSFEYYGYSVASVDSAYVNLWRFDSADAAVRAIEERERTYGTDDYADFDTGSLTLVTKADFKIQATGYDGYVNFYPYADLGAGYDKGVYLAEAVVTVTGNDKEEITQKCYGFIQISEILPYTLSSDGKTLIWVKDIDENDVSGAEISGTAFNRADGWAHKTASDIIPVSAVTGKDGTVVIENGERSAMVIAISRGDDEVVACVNTSATDENEYYLNYLYTDRETYFSNDTVNFAGFVVPLYGGEIPDALYLQAGSSGIKTRINYNEDGSFSGSYAIENMSARGISIKIVDADGKIYAAKFISVTLEEKPVITASLSFDKLFYRYGDTMKVTVRSTFYDGTPAPGFSFSVVGGVGGTSIALTPQKATTDKNGECVFTCKLGSCRASSTGPLTITVNAELVSTETQTLRISGSALYFHSDYVYTINYDADCRRVTLNYRDTSAIKTADDLNYSFIRENTVGRPASEKVTYKLIKYVVTKTEKTVYDSYTKKTFKTYDYSTSRYTVDSGTLSFTDGVAKLPIYKVEGFTGGYYYELEFNDGHNTYGDTVGATKGGYFYSDSDKIRYGVFTDKTEYAVGDTVRVTQRTAAGNTGRLLYAVFGNGLMTYGVGEAFEFTYTEDMIPGAVVVGVAFRSGAEGMEFGGSNVRLFYAYRTCAALDTDISTDKDSYKPGETAVLTVKGTPGEEVLISVVDEACFALGEQEADVGRFFDSVRSLGNYIYYYSSYYSSSVGSVKAIVFNARFGAVENVYDRNSYKALDAPEAEGKNPEGTNGADSTASAGNKSYYVRKYFADNPVFTTVTLDGNGEGKIVFTVPDNLTTWRVTATAVSGLGGDLADIKVGSTVETTVCTQPFFVNANVCTRYIVGDDVSASFRSFGREANGTVSYRAVLTRDGETLADVRTSGEPLEYAKVRFGKLEEGQYKITVYADCGDATDAVETSFAVVGSNLTVPVVRDVKIDEISDISPALYPVTLTFYTETPESSLYNGILNTLAYGNPSERADMLAAKYAALSVRAQLYGAASSDEIKAVADRLSGYGSGFFSLLTYSAPDPVLTAKILALDPNIADLSRRDNLVSLYTAVVESINPVDEETLCASLLGLAALGEPVLDRLYSVASVAGGYSAEAKLYLAAAFACIGDYPAAYDVYSGVRDAVGIYDEEYGTLYFNGKTIDDNIALTSAAMLAAARISASDAAAMAKYLTGNMTRDESPEIALACYLRFFVPTDAVTERTLVYDFGDGNAKTVTLKRGRTFGITLTKPEFDAFRVVSADEGVSVKAYYLGSAEEAYTEKSDRVTVNKTITAYGENMYRVTLTFSGKSARIYESFDITDCIPSGARYVSIYSDRYSSGGSNVVASAYIYNSAGQNMSGRLSVYNAEYANSYSRRNVYLTACPEYSFSTTVSYIIRGAVDGDYVVESAALKNSATGFFAASERSYITIDSGKLTLTKK